MGNLDSMLDELNNMENSITLRDENGEEVKLYVLEETKLNGESYLLASDTKDGDGECYLFPFSINAPPKIRFLDFYSISTPRSLISSANTLDIYSSSPSSSTNS